MKNRDFELLLETFYKGLASEQEIELLKSERLIDVTDEIYASTLKAERAVKLDWSFDDLQIAAKPAIVKKMQHKSWHLKLAVAAAVISILFFTFYSIWFQEKQVTNDGIANSQIPILKDSIISKNQTVAVIEKVQPAFVEVNTKKTSGHKKNIARKTSVSKNKIEPVKTDPKQEEWLVIVNGKPITNEDEAVSIAKKSMAKLSSNLTVTMDKLNSISKIKIKL